MSLSKNSNMDALIKSAAHVLIDDTAEYMRSIDTSNTIISKKLDKKIQKRIRQNTLANYWDMVPVGMKKAIAAVLVFCTISFATCMSVEAVREDMWNTILKWYDKFVAVYFVTEESTPKVIEDFGEPTLQLAGTERIVEKQTDTWNQIHYVIDDDIAMIYYQRLITDSSADFDAEHGCVKETVDIGNYKGVLFTYDNGKKTLTWHDNEYIYVLLLYQSIIDNNTLIQLAESVK